MDTSKEAENTIDEYCMEQKHIVGCNKKSSRYDLLSVVMICLSKNKDAGATDNELLKMLLTLLDEELGAEEKKKRLEEEHGIPMTVRLAQEVNDMCNLSEYYEERGMERGMKKGIEKGIEKGIQSLVETLKELGQTNEFIVNKIMEKFALTETQARKFLY